MANGSGGAPETRPISGIVLVDKPAGSSSNRVLQRTKRLFAARKAGHTGTLDPMATGMLPVCLGAATRVSGLMLGATKRYSVTAEFGIATDTGDRTGTVIERRDSPAFPIEVLQPILQRFVGKGEQTPPMYSALKRQGRRLYELARAGQEVERPPRQIEIFEIVAEALDWPRLAFRVHCSKGTYVRSLVVDLAAALGTVAHVTALRRTAVGPFGESQMVPLETLEDLAQAGREQLDRWLLPIDSALQDKPAITVAASDALALRHGRSVGVDCEDAEASFRVYDPAGILVGLGVVSRPGLLRPSCIFPA